MKAMGNFKLQQRMMRYSKFVPRLYNLCLSLGFEQGKIMPSRAFCSDENQGYPIILLTKHFGTFPFNHGRVGGVVATDRHGPHAHHGEDMVILQSSHVGYDPESRQFGRYCRLQTRSYESTSDCGKISAVLSGYLREYHFACENILVERNGAECLVTIDNLLLDSGRTEGLQLRLGRMLRSDSSHQGNDEYHPIEVRSTAKTFVATEPFADRFIHLEEGESQVVGSALSSDLFHFLPWRQHPTGEQRDNTVEENLLPHMPLIVTADSPMLVAAQFNSQVEFDRTFRTIARGGASYRGKRLLFISGIHIDISPEIGQVFPLTKFVPWAGYFQDRDGSHLIYEQEELWELLMAQPIDNPDAIDLEEAIEQMERHREVVVEGVR